MTTLPLPLAFAFIKKDVKWEEQVEGKLKGSLLLYVFCIPKQARNAPFFLPLFLYHYHKDMRLVLLLV